MGIAGDFVLIVVAGLAGAVAARALGLPLLVGYIAAGVAVGPHTAGPTVANIEDIELLSEIGVALLLFALGLEISLRDLRAVRAVAVVGGPLQIVFTGAFAAWLGRAGAGMTGVEALWFGAMAALSSTMVVLKTLAATGTQATLASRVMIGLLVIQDLAVVPMLIVLPQLGATSGTGGRLLRAGLLAGTFLLGMVLAGTRLLPPILRVIVRWGSRELFLVAVVAASVGVGALAHEFGLSFAIGAFVAGLVLSESELSHQALSDVAPLRDVFGLLFFVTVGMLLDPRVVLDRAGAIALLVGALVAGKAAIAGGIARAFGYRNLAPWIVGLGLAQVGEFGVVLARAGRAGGFLSAGTYDLVLACTILSMAISPLVFPGLLPAVRAWTRWLRPPVAGDRELPVTRLENHAIVAGYGRTGRAVVDALVETGVPHLALDSSHDALAAPLEQGLPVIWGDVASEHILDAAGVAQARMLVAAVPDRHAARAAIAYARRVNPRIFVVARATTAEEVEALRALRVDAMVQPEFEGGIEMVRRALVELDRSGDDVDGVVAELRRRQYDPPGAS
ncbi:MAG: cation:proton antiporter [Vicinamibacterales bacterium]